MACASIRAPNPTVLAVARDEEADGDGEDAKGRRGIESVGLARVQFSSLVDDLAGHPEDELSQLHVHASLLLQCCLPVLLLLDAEDPDVLAELDEALGQ